jgi:hypothetical protein
MPFKAGQRDSRAFIRFLIIITMAVSQLCRISLCGDCFAGAVFVRTGVTKQRGLLATAAPSASSRFSAAANNSRHSLEHLFPACRPSLFCLKTPYLVRRTLWL